MTPSPSGRVSSLTRRTPLRSKPKGRGSRGEREIVDLCHEFGWTEARRNWMSGGQGGADIINGPAGVSLEVKYCEQARIWQWIAQSEAAARATDIPAVIFRRNRGRWWACAPADEWEALQELRPVQVWMVVRESERVSLYSLLDEAVDAAGLDAVPRVRFRRGASGWYMVGSAVEFFGLLWERELAA